MSRTTRTARTSGARRRGRTALLALPLLAAAVLATGCSAGSGSSSDSAAGPGYIADGGAVAPGAPSTDGRSAEGEGTGTGGGVDTAVQDRSVIVRADLTVRVDDLAAADAGLQGVILKYGATIESQTTSSDGYIGLPATDAASTCPETGCPTPYSGSVTLLRVSNDDVDDVLADLERLGTRVSSVRTSQDVTGEVADVASRLDNARRSVAQVRALMGRATKLSDVVLLEAELTKRQSDLEALEARQRVLADQTAQATITVRLVDPSAPAPVEEKETGFLAGLAAGWDAFTGAVVVALTVLGAVLPFLLVLVPLGLLVWWLARRGSRRAADEAPAAS
jgi:predicted lipid-binding transport protein (Tim44 family)